MQIFDKVDDDVQTPETIEDTPTEVVDFHNAEKVLSIIATVILVLGVLTTVMCLFNICWVDSGRYIYSKDIVFNPMGFATTIAILMGTLATWGVLRVLCNISNSLKVLRDAKLGE